jgi:UDP-3-O-[3-hydroxymyristoyl] glucosamine N-acyltransferase
MADPRFYDNHGPFTLADICASAGAGVPPGAAAFHEIFDMATLLSAAPQHLAFFAGGAAKDFAQTQAGFCFVPGEQPARPGTILIPCVSPSHAFAAAVHKFYPEHGLAAWNQKSAIDPSAKIAATAKLAPGVVVGPHAELGDGTQVGPNTVIGRGVAIGRNCEIGANVTITHTYIGDDVVILPGAQIGQPGFGFASGPSGHIKIPQIGRVIIQDKVEIGACTTIDRGALGDTVIGEGTKIDNLVQIGHNTHIGRHCIIVAQTGISGSCELGDFVVLGGQAGVADHAQIGDGARIAARGAAGPGHLPGGQDYGGVPVRPMRQWARELAAVTILAKRKRKTND